MLNLKTMTAAVALLASAYAGPALAAMSAEMAEREASSVSKTAGGSWTTAVRTSSCCYRYQRSINGGGVLVNSGPSAGASASYSTSAGVRGTPSLGPGRSWRD